MKRMRISYLFLAALLFVRAPLAVGATIDLSPAAQAVPVGNQVQIDVKIGDLHSAVGAYDLVVDFNPAILSFDSLTFGDPKLGDLLDMGWGVFTNIDTSQPASVEFQEVSFASAKALASQPGSFTLAVLNFDTHAAGSGRLGISVTALGDALGSTIESSATGSTFVAGSVATVPEPAAFFLLGSGLFLLVMKKLRPRSDKG